jgi:hypothetical protein
MAKLFTARTIETENGTQFDLAIDPNAVVFIMRTEVANGPDMKKVPACLVVISGYSGPLILADPEGDLITRINAGRE